MSRSRGIPVALLLAASTACDGSGGAPATPDDPSGPTPRVEPSLAFDDAPLEGLVYLRPEPSTVDWRYAVDVDEDGVFDHQGTLTRDIGFAYRFTSPGVHRIRVDLEGPDGPRTIEHRVIVNDPAALRILAQRQVGPFTGLSFEGITTNRSGSTLYVSDFRLRELFRLDAQSLEQLGPALDLSPQGPSFPRGGPEGLSVTPSDSLLYIGNSHPGMKLTVVAVPDMIVRRQVPAGGLYVHALDDTLALTNEADAISPPAIVDTRTGAVVRTLGSGMMSGRHFSVSRDGSMVAFLQGFDPSSIILGTLPGLQEAGRIEFPAGGSVIAFHPTGDRLYVMGSRLLVVDVARGTVISDLAMGTGCFLCAANPAAMSRSGRFIAFERSDGVYFIDTELDLPLYYTPVGRSVTASPTEDDVFYVLHPDGLVSRIAVEP